MLSRRVASYSRSNKEYHSIAVCLNTHMSRLLRMPLTSSKETNFGKFAGAWLVEQEKNIDTSSFC